MTAPVAGTFSRPVTRGLKMSQNRGLRTNRDITYSNGWLLTPTPIADREMALRLGHGLAPVIWPEIGATGDAAGIRLSPLCISHSHINIDCADPYRRAMFWAELTGWTEHPDEGKRTR
ncbi:MAG: VOC family protein [Geodermatophilaceae bacterium]